MHCYEMIRYYYIRQYDQSCICFVALVSAISALPYHLWMHPVMTADRDFNVHETRDDSLDRDRYLAPGPRRRSTTCFGLATCSDDRPAVSARFTGLLQTGSIALDEGRAGISIPARRRAVSASSEPIREESSIFERLGSS